MKIFRDLQLEGWENRDEIIERHDGMIPSVLNNLGKMRDALMSMNQAKIKRRKREAGYEIRLWQSKLIDYVLEDNERQFHWFYETKGNVGKSWLANHMVTHHNFSFVKPGKNADMAESLVSQFTGHSRFVFDLTRSCKTEDVSTFGQVPDIIEDLKNGRICRKKYMSDQLEVPMPTVVVVFANTPPPEWDEEAWEVADAGKAPWSVDRYNVFNMRRTSFINKFGSVESDAVSVDTDTSVCKHRKIK